MNILDILTENELKLYTKRITLKKDSIIFSEQEECNYIGYLLKGRIKISTYTNSEKEEVITIINKEEFFGQFLAFSANNKFLGNGICEIETEYLYIKKENLLKLLQSNSLFLNYYLEEIAKESRIIKEQAKLLAHKNINDRLLYYIRTHSSNNYFMIKNITILSKLISLPRPSVERALKELENKGIIERDYNCIKIL